ncbi:MAG TPA: DUF2341 domain-containing protein, partial [Spirochaetia bacterium]|nr:DUF2341 domain-containing protein [Spirochaetia bacterium]
MRRTNRRLGIHLRSTRRLRILAVVALLAAGSVPGLLAQSWYNQAWTSRQQITISSNAYGLGTDLVRFPFLVKVTNPANELFAKAQTSGNDIVFTASDGVTKLPHEIENYSSGGTDLTAWVQIPVFSHTVATIIYMYYGNPNAGSQQQPTQVWDSSYGSVYHLKENGANGTYADSTSNANAGLGGTVSTNHAPTRTATALSGYGQSFNPADPDYITVTGRMGQPSSATISAWVNLTAANTNGSEVFSIGDSLGLRLNDPTISGHVDGFFYDGTTYHKTDAGVGVGTGAYHLVTYRLDNVTQRSYLYIDGVLKGTASFTGSPSYSLGANTFIGTHGNGGVAYDFNGALDEVRFSSASRSDDWIATEYQTQAASAQGAPATPGTVDNTKFIKMKSQQFEYFQYKVAVTINGSLVVGTQTNFPVLVHVGLPAGHVLNANAYDTMFTDASGNVLSHEVEYYNAGDFWAWVKVPILQNGADTLLYLYYGNPNIATPPNSSAVWDSNFMMVQHLNTSPAGTLTDSTSNGNSGTSNGMVAGNLGAGQTGRAVSFDGTHYVSVPTNATLNPTTRMTVSAWVNFTSASGNQKLVSKMNPPTAGYNLAGQTSGTFGIYPEVIDSASSPVVTFTTGNISAGAWTYLVMTWATSGKLIGYINGAQVNSVNATANPVGASPNNLVMGTASWNLTTFQFTGSMGEVRLSNIDRSPNWIATEYNNQSNTAVGAGNFIKSLGAETPAYSSWWNGSWNYRKTLTLNADKVGLTNIPRNDSDLASMPVLLSFIDPDLAANAQGGGGDITWVINGQQLSHELVSFDKTSGTVVAWVNIPAISSYMDTPVDMYYGNPSAAAQQNVPGTWSNGFSGVWHLEESGGGGGSLYKDSSPAGSNGASGTVTITGAPTAAAGKIAGGQSFNGTSNQITTSLAINNPQDFTISAWINTASNSGRKVMGFEINPTGTASANYDRQLYIGTNGFVYFGCYSGTNDSATSGAALALGTWHYLVGVRNNGASTVTLYVDGTAFGPVANSSAEVETGYWRIGGYKLTAWANGADGYFPGSIDEARISTVSRTADWVKAEWTNQNSPGTNIAFGAPSALWTWTGGTGTPWSVPGSWNPASVPNDNTKQVVIGTPAGGPALDQAITVKRLTIQPGRSLDLAGFTLSIADSNGLSNQGTIYFTGSAGSSTDSISVMDTTAGTVVYHTTAANIRSFGTVDYDNLTVDGIPANLTTNITVAGNLALANGATLSLNGHTLTVQGDVTGTGTVLVGSGTLVVQGSMTVSTVTATNGLIQIAKTFNPGSFTAGTGSTVEFVNSAWNGEILGTRSFYNLKIVTAGKTVLFQDGVTQSVTSTFTVTGSLAGQVSLRSVTDGSQWTISPAGSSVSYAFVKDSVASSVIVANNSTNGGNNNANWQFNTAGQLHHFAISAITTPQTAGVPFSITITAQDASNATVPGFTGTVAITDRTGTITPVVSASFVGGVDTENVMITATATNVTIVVSSGTIQGQSGAFDVQAYSPYSGLVGWWKLDDGAGTSALDSSVSASTGTLVNAPTWVAGRVGGALSFGGTSYVNVTNTAPYNITGPITVAAWVNAAAWTVAWQAVVTKGTSAWRLQRNSTGGGNASGICFSTNGLTNVDLAGTRTIIDGTWHHVVGVYDGATKYIYVDGALDTSVAATGSIATDAFNVYIAENAQNTGRQFVGQIDDVRIYNVALSAGQVAALYYQSTTYTWVGTTTSWTAPTNWSPYGPPGAADTAVIATTGTSTYPQLAAPTSAKNLQIYSSASVDLNGSNLTLSGTLTNSGTIFLLGAESINGGAGFSGSAGNVTYRGTADYSAVPGKLAAGNSYAALSFTGAAGIWKLNAAASAASVLVAAGSTLDLSTFAVTGAATFTNNGTLRIAGGAQTIAGTKINGAASTVEYYGVGSALAWGGSYQNLRINGSGTFAAATSLTIPGTLTLAAGALSSGANPVTLSGDFASTGGTFTSTGLLTLNGTVPQAFNPTGSTFGSVTINATGPVTLGGALSMGGTLTLTAGTLAAAANGVSVGGDFTRTGGAFTSTGLLTFNGTAAQAFTPTGSTIQNLAIANTGPSTVSLNGALTVGGTLTISSGTLDVTTLNNYAVNVAGNWSVSGGSFNARSGTVTFTGAGTTVISGSTTFYNFGCAQAGKTIQFTNGTTQTISGTFTITGIAGSLISLVSTSSPSQWIINPSAASAVNYALVQDSQVTGSNTIAANASKDNGNNTIAPPAPGWIFPPATLTWTGGANTDWNNGGNWNGGYAPNASDSAIIANAGAQPATLTTNASIVNLTINTGAAVSTSGHSLGVGGNLTGAGTAALTATASEAISVGGNWNVTSFTPATSTVTFTGASGAGPFTVTSNAQSFSTVVLNAGGKTYQQAAGVNGVANMAALTLTAGTWSTNGETLTVSGSLSGGGSLVATASEAINVGADFTPGSFTPANSTVTLNGATAASVSGLTFYNLVINKAAQVDTVSSTGGWTVTNALTMTRGTWLAGAGLTHTIAGAWDSSSATFTFTAGTSTITL